MPRFTEYHGGVAVIKDKSQLKEAMAKLAEYEDREETGCKGCCFEQSTKELYPCRVCCRNCTQDRYER